VSFTEIGSFSFLRADYTAGADFEDGSLAIRYCAYLTVINGYQMLFTFGVPEQSDASRYMEDFEYMLKNLTVHNIGIDNPAAGFAASEYLIEFILGILLILLFAACCFMYKQRRMKDILRREEEESEPGEDADGSQEESGMEKIENESENADKKE